MRTLEKLTIKNFKSIREQTLELGRLNVFIGGNGAGKVLIDNAAFGAQTHDVLFGRAADNET